MTGRVVVLALLFPIAWTAWTMAFGAVDGWYPYPFLNPAQPGGYGAVAVYVVAIAGFIGLMACVVIALSRTKILAR